MELQGKKVAVLVEQKYEDLELWYPRLRLMEAGAEVVVVGPKAGATFPSKNGYPATADIGAEGARAADFDAVIVPGGFAPDYMRRTPAMVAFVREAFREGKVVAAICHAGWMLASAGILRGKRATSFHSLKDDMVNAGAEWVDQEVVRDGALITSRNPDDLPAFCREIIGALREAPVGAGRGAA